MKRQALALAMALALLAACAADPAGQVDAQAAADANANLGIDYMRKGHNDLALERLQRALSYQPGHVRANWALAIVYARLQETTLADRHFQRAIAERPAPEILNSYGAFLCQRGQTEEAVELFVQAAGNPRYTNAADALANAGVCMARAGNADAAEQYLRRALALDAQQAQALGWMARLLVARGDHLGARAFLQRLDAVAALQGDLLLLAARNEIGLNDRGEARAYLRRYNLAREGQIMTMDQLAVPAHD